MRLVVLGDPVAHSLSPAIQTAAMAAAGLPGSYEALKVDREGMAEAVDDIRQGRLDGANVTMPHKQLAAQLCDTLDPLAARVGAVNTIVRVGSMVIGHNTDVAGVRAAWRRGQLPDDGPVLVLGGGGAAAAALLALEDRDLFISGRSPSRIAALAERLGVEVRSVGWGEGIPGASVVNATPLGMRGEELPGATIAGAAGLFDMTYGGGRTPAVESILSRGLPHVDGAAMLVAQAEESFRLWTGRAADRGAMTDAMDEIRIAGGRTT